MKTSITLILSVGLALLGGVVLHGAAGSAPVILEGLTREEALARAERRHPQLAEARAQAEAAAGRAEQAGSFPNPEAILGAQQIPVKSYAEPDRQYLAGFSQPIPLGNRLARAREAELLEREVRLRGLEAAHRALTRRVQGAFAAALYHESVFQTHLRIVEGYRSAAARERARVAAGDASPVESARIELELARAEAEQRRSEAFRIRSLASLAGAMGEAGVEVRTVSGRLDDAFEVPTIESLAAAVQDHPSLVTARAEVRASAARVDLAKAERIPDIRVEALYHRLEVSGQNTLDFGVSIPLPIFNRNRGRLKEARSEAEAAEARARMTAVELESGLRQAHAGLMANLQGLRTFRDEILPRAGIVLKAAEARLEAGDASLTEILPVRREWAGLHLAYLELLRDAMDGWIEVSGYLGTKGGGGQGDRSRTSGQ